MKKNTVQLKQDHDDIEALRQAQACVRIVNAKFPSKKNGRLIDYLQEMIEDLQ